MTRADADTFRCIVCGETTKHEVICYGCTMAEWKKQKLEPGSITGAQIYFIERKCLSKLSEEVGQKILLEVVPDWQGLENLSCQQAKDITAKLLDKIETQA